MKRVGCLGLVIVLVVLGFALQQRNIDQLRKEVKSISGKVQVQNGKVNAGGGSDLVTALARAESHTKRARELLKNHRTAEAQAELDKALTSLNSAHNVSKDIVGQAAEVFGKARKNAEDVFRKAWQDISEEATSKKKSK
jgi:cell division septum initiation protein DivIVA